MNYRIYASVILLLLISLVGFSQKKRRHGLTEYSPTRDSLAIYKKIEEISKRRKITYKIYQSVFKYNTPPPSTSHHHHHSNAPKTKKPKESVRKKTMDEYDGAIIRNIIITSLDPGGYNINDTATKPSNFSEKTVNFLHIKSKRFTIRNHLLFWRGDTLDPLKIRESERILRTSNYIHDAIITVVPINKKGDSVDVKVLTQDRWSLIPSGGYGAENSFTLRDNNIIGTGQQFEQTVATRGLMDSAYYYKGNYSIPYIRHTFITAGAFYSTDYRNENKGITLSRPFFSPLTMWAGGFVWSANKVPTGIFLSPYDINANRFQLNYTYMDMWNGWSFPIFKSRNYGKRSTRLVTAFRYSQTVYSSTLPKGLDPFSLYQSSDNWFGSVGISKRRFYKDRYIFKFGVTEDVPTGFLVSLTGGVQRWREGGSRTYTGMLASWSGDIRNQYVSAYIETGAYHHYGTMEQGIVRASAGTFTELMNLGKWKLRQFFVIQGTYGFNRSPTERLNINGSNGLRGFNSPTVFGTNKMLMYVQSQLYAPYSWAGFKFAPVMYVGLGMVGNEQERFYTNQVHPFFALGVQIRNELLVFNTFQFTFGYYPYVPGTGSNIFKFNPITTDQIQFRQPQMGAPGDIPFY